jgi:hypothetical protein
MNLTHDKLIKAGWKITGKVIPISETDKAYGATIAITLTAPSGRYATLLFAEPMDKEQVR